MDSVMLFPRSSSLLVAETDLETRSLPRLQNKMIF